MQLINDMERMQQEAVRRAREMQQRARIPTPPKAEAPLPEEHTEKQSRPRQEAPQETQSFSEVLFKDREKTLILCLILLLTDEKSDSSLIFALLYLLI